MKNFKHKKLLIGTLSITFVFIIYNIFWYFIVHNKYDKFTANMEEIYKNKTYAINKGGYDYNVKIPNYLSFVGNLGIADSEHRNVLIIWVNALTNKVEYGVRIQSDNETYEIMLDSNMKPINNIYLEIVQDNEEIISKLFEKAKQNWTILE